MYKNNSKKCFSFRFPATTFNFMLERMHSELSGESRNIKSIFLNRMYHPGHSANELALKAKCDYKSVLQYGRSMIEMLGVLAIIGVLSVGGIAGYSKAMEKFKVNKAVSEYSYLIQGLMEHLDNIQRMSNIQEGDVHHGLVNVVQAAALVPETWKNSNNAADDRMIDPYGNVIHIFSRNERLVIDMYLGGFSSVENGSASLSFSPKFCSVLMQDVVKPLSSVLHHVWFTNGSGLSYSGDKFCSSGKKCVRNLTLGDIQKTCNYCTNGKLCGLILEF